MAGWSKLGDGSCIHQCSDSLRNEKRDLQSNFIELVSGFLKGTCGSNCFRPLPPMLGNGHCVDLLKLYFVVKQKGGFEAISQKKLWDEVGLQCGLGSGFGTAFKLIYAKYLSSMESWLMKLPEDKKLENKVNKVLMGLERDYGSFVSNIREGMRRSDSSCSFKAEKSGISFVDLTGEGDDDDEEDKKLNWKKFVMGFVDSGDSIGGNDDEAVKPKQQNVEMSFADDEDSTEGNDGTKKLNQLKVEMRFVDAGDSTEGKNEAVRSKRGEVEMSFVNGAGLTGESHGGENSKRAKSEVSFVDGISSDGSDNGRSSVGPIFADDVVKSTENSYASKKCSTEDEELMNVDSGILKEVSSHKRKRYFFSGMLCWMAKVAKDPIDPVIGDIPECTKWASYGNDNCWKQVLLARQALFLKTIRVSSAELSSCQKRQKMHPSLFEDRTEPAERPRYSPRILSDNTQMASYVEADTYPGRPRQRLEARLDLKPTASIYTSRPQQRIPVGKPYQAEVPEWTGVVVESDSKWLGTRVWPLEKKEKRPLVERDPIGKGRIDTCGCQFPGSLECVKFHVAERRMKMKFELGSAFYTWSFNKMGEEFSVSWTTEEEKKFKDVVKENPLSLQKCFWKLMYKALPEKTWADQVNYYFNVFMLRRRGYQNRFNQGDIDSDDDEIEYRSTANSFRHETAESCVSVSSSKRAHMNIN